jgi:hypothetical protein
MANYDLAIDAGKLGAEKAAKIIVEYVKQLTK